MHSVILFVLVFLWGGNVWAAQPQAPTMNTPVVSSPTVHSPTVTPPLAPLVPQPELYLPSSSINLTEAWLHSTAPRMYWNGVARPTQINMGVGSFRDPALVPPLFSEQKPRARSQRSRVRSGNKATSVNACQCKTPVKCTCVVPAQKCECRAADASPARLSAKPSSSLVVTAPPLAQTAAPAQRQAAAVPPLPAPATTNVAPLPPALPAVPAPRPPAVPKTPTRLQ